MPHTITAVEAGSVADQLGIRPGDALTQINGEPIIDWVDYQALTSIENIQLELVRDGETLELAFEKDDYEPLGISFADDMMGPIRTCENECVFCFVDQLPAGTRESMHLKDDDWRTSLMMGSFVTLTNVTDSELDRIISRHATPLYISVHATEDDLREAMLGTPRGAGILRMLRKLKDGGISFHLQCVLCPGVNDGADLDRTIEDLSGLIPAARSLALVPVGLTGHREGLPALSQYDWHAANDLIDQANGWRKRLLKQHGTRFVHLADEFYILAGRQFPADETYEGYPQIDNGVGLCRMLETELHDGYGYADLKKAVKSRTAIACGVSVAAFLSQLMREHPVPGVEVSVHAVKNAFFGPTVTVSGLLTGSDLVREMQGVQADRLLITACMLRDGEDVFLDDMALGEVEDALGMPVIPVGRTGEALLEAIAGANLFDD